MLDGYASRHEMHMQALESAKADSVERVTLAAFIFVGAALGTT